MKTLFIGIDESGTLGELTFCYCGFAILGTEKYYGKMRKYMRVEKSLNYNHELKGSNLNSGERNKLLSVVENEMSFGIICHDTSIPNIVKESSVSKLFYKDEMIEEIVTELMMTYDKGSIEKIVVLIDEQNMRSNHNFNLYNNLYKQFNSGHLYKGKYYPPIFETNVQLVIKYVNSTKEPFVRCSDLLANKVYNYSLENEDISKVLKKFKVL